MKAAELHIPFLLKVGYCSAVRRLFQNGASFSNGHLYFSLSGTNNIGASEEPRAISILALLRFLTFYSLVSVLLHGL